MKNLPFSILLATFALAACDNDRVTTNQPIPPPLPASMPAAASVNLQSRSNSQVGGALSLTAAEGGVLVSGRVTGLAPDSEHGFHVHETGDCSAPDGTSAGAHFNPTGDRHGNPASLPRHVGDLPNIRADGTGVATVEMRVTGVTLGDGSPTDIARRAIVVHAKPDDYTSQPAGDAGDRLACGVIDYTPG